MTGCPGLRNRYLDAPTWYVSAVRVFVTGASGFISSHLVHRLLGDAHAVPALVRNLERASAVLRRDTEVVCGDVSRLDSLRLAVRDMDCVVHAAAPARLGALVGIRTNDGAR